MSKKTTESPSVAKRREEALKRKKEQERQRWLIVGGILVVVALALGAIWFLSQPDEVPEEAAAISTVAATGAAAAPSADRPLAALDPAARNNYFSEPPPMTINTSKTYDAVITMADGGSMRLRLFDDESPIAVNSFVFLANQGFFDGLTFHRVLPNFMAQGGDPTGSGSGGPGYQFVNETDNGLSFDRPHLLAMANAGPDTNGSQFFITFEPTPNLNGGYTIFGELTEGEDVLNAITKRDPQFNPTEEGSVIQSIAIEEQS